MAVLRETVWLFVCTSAGLIVAMLVSSLVDDNVIYGAGSCKPPCTLSTIEKNECAHFDMQPIMNCEAYRCIKNLITNPWCETGEADCPIKDGLPITVKLNQTLRAHPGCITTVGIQEYPPPVCHFHPPFRTKCETGFCDGVILDPNTEFGGKICGP